MVKFQKKTISPVIATALLVVISVVAVVGFQSWFSTFSSKIFSENEIKSQDVAGSLVIESIVSDSLFVRNTLPSTNITVTQVKIDGVSCNISNQTICNMSVATINVSPCLSGVSAGVKEILVVTTNAVNSKKLFLKDLPSVAAASESGSFNGNFSLTGYAYNENVGYISFNGSSYNVTFRDNVSQGYAYNENTGFISFNGSNYNVTLLGNTSFQGYAYSETIGFISFNGSNYNVTLSNSRVQGYAYNENIGFIHFNHSSSTYNVTYS